MKLQSRKKEKIMKMIFKLKRFFIFKFIYINSNENKRKKETKKKI